MEVQECASTPGRGTGGGGSNAAPPPPPRHSPAPPSPHKMYSWAEFLGSGSSWDKMRCVAGYEIVKVESTGSVVVGGGGGGGGSADAPQTPTGRTASTLRTALASTAGGGGGGSSGGGAAAAAVPRMSLPATAVLRCGEATFRMRAFRAAAGTSEREVEQVRTLAAAHACCGAVELLAFVEEGRAVVALTRWDASVGVARRMSPASAAQKASQLLQETLALREALCPPAAAGGGGGGEVPSLAVKPSNIACSPYGALVLHDWYVPYLSGCSAAAQADRRGLAHWLHLAVHGRLPTAYAVRGDGELSEDYKDFVLRLLDGNTEAGLTADLLDAPWLCRERENHMALRKISAQRLTRRGRACAGPADLAPRGEDAVRLVQSAMHAASRCGEHGDRFYDAARVFAVRHDAESFVARLASLEAPLGKDDLDVCATYRNDDGAATAPAVAAERALARLPPAEWEEGVWFGAPGGGHPNEDTCALVKHLSVYSGRSAEGLSAVDYGVGVFDGHGGGEAAAWCAQQLLPSVCSSRHYPESMEEAMREAFLSTHQRYCKATTGFDCAAAGSTATAVVVRAGVVHAANVGDSAAVVGGCGGRCVVLTAEHRATDPEERALVEARGGAVVSVLGVERVEGRLAVTRSIGDAALAAKLTAVPHYAAHPLAEGDEFVVVASDGLWDVMRPEQVCQFVCDARDEVDYAKERRSSVHTRSSRLTVETGGVHTSRSTQSAAAAQRAMLKRASCGGSGGSLLSCDTPRQQQQQPAGGVGTPVCPHPPPQTPGGTHSSPLLRSSPMSVATQPPPDLCGSGGGGGGGGATSVAATPPHRLHAQLALKSAEESMLHTPHLPSPPPRARGKKKSTHPTPTPQTVSLDFACFADAATRRSLALAPHGMFGEEAVAVDAAVDATGGGGGMGGPGRSILKRSPSASDSAAVSTPSADAAGSLFRPSCSSMRVSVPGGEASDAGSPSCGASALNCEDYQLVPEALVAEARELGSSDDITVCILFLARGTRFNDH